MSDSQIPAETGPYIPIEQNSSNPDAEQEPIPQANFDDLQRQLMVQQQQIHDLTVGLKTLVDLHKQRAETVFQPYINDVSHKLCAVSESHQAMTKELAERDPRAELGELRSQLKQVFGLIHQTRQTIVEQRNLLQEHLGIKVLILQFGVIGAIAGLTVVLGVMFMPGGLRQIHETIDLIERKIVFLWESQQKIEKELGIPDS